MIVLSNRIWHKTSSNSHYKYNDISYEAQKSYDSFENKKIKNKKHIP